ncbi:o-succinylbenzoate synthase [Micrococcus sp. FDAARGOS_333]|uniref:o-succinylbenzoate synthase n=1 Tax=Micrococcus sp. FDAARGOS_333 TaxID=1930558 RepID=UPI000B4E0A40|nr:o-succinylbenzoate synthase [Micrococcus sp. FDAARGOS_333]PNL18542.1 O-succinylbenzoate synthase [Micrococcus sp. FDAARGOS_333]
MSADTVLPPLPGAPAGPSLPSVEELLEHAVAVSLPMTVRFRGTTRREALLLRGPAGWAEFSPFPEYGDEESSRWLAAAVEAGWQGWPEPVRDAVPVNATVPAVAAEDVERVLATYGDGITAVKVKVAEHGPDGRLVAGSREEDLARVRRVRELLPQAALRVDANMGWTHEQAVDVLTELEDVGLEYAEQPVPGIEPLAAVRRELRERGVPTRIAADEAVRKEADPLAVAQADAADLIVVKVQPLGGVRRAAAIVEAAGLDAVVSSALDTSVGLAGSAALAAHLPRLPFACGLGTGALFSRDVCDPAWTPSGGMLPVPGVSAPEPDPALLDAVRADAASHDRWARRVHGAHAVLAAQH